jgi:hypothetical protein
VTVASTRGGVYSTNLALAGRDHQESHLKTVFGFCGIADVQFAGRGRGDAGDAPCRGALVAADLINRSLSAAPANQPEAALAACASRNCNSTACASQAVCFREGPLRWLHAAAPKVIALAGDES